MRVAANVLVWSLVVCGLVSGATTDPPDSTRTSPSPPKRNPTATPPNPNQAINDRLAEQVAAKIAGHENEPAGQVFKNIEIFKDVPAKRLLLIMNLGYSRALGVACTHCHVEQDFASDDKRPKRAAREMAAMHRMINDELGKMKNLDSTVVASPKINCSTCHRGAIDPMAADR